MVCGVTVSCRLCMWIIAGMDWVWLPGAVQISWLNISGRTSQYISHPCDWNMILLFVTALPLSCLTILLPFRVHCLCICLPPNLTHDFPSLCPFLTSIIPPYFHTCLPISLTSTCYSLCLSPFIPPLCQSSLPSSHPPYLCLLPPSSPTFYLVHSIPSYYPITLPLFIPSFPIFSLASPSTLLFHIMMKMEYTVCQQILF